jgi:energy-coupling factor transporter ATP-binding protein EcfA2
MANYGFKRASTIKVPQEFFNPLITGIKAVDDSWSELGGIVPSQVTFITGNPGAGKTTLTLAIGGCLASKGDIAFISLEMSDFQLANQAKKIPGFGGVHISADFDQEETLKQIRALSPKLIILDSIQKAARKMKDEFGKPIPFDRAQYMIVEMFTAYAKETWTPVFLIGHCDKSGNYKGPSDLLHDVDSHLTVHYDKDMDLRTFTFGKNRFGGSMDEHLFGISKETVWVGSPYISRVYEGANITYNDQEYEEPESEEAAPTNELLASLENLKGAWNGSNARALIFNAVAKLKNCDPDFATSSFVKDPSKVKLRFGGNTVAHCHPRSGELVFGKKSFTDMVIGKVGYAKEQKFIKERCEDNADLLLWVTVHEWMHLYEGNQQHTNNFFEQVAAKYDWLIEQIS